MLMLGINNNKKIKPAGRKNTTKSSSYAIEEESLFSTKTGLSSILAIKKEMKKFLNDEIEGELREASFEKRKQTKKLLEHLSESLSNLNK